MSADGLRITIGDVIVECVRGDIADQPGFDAVVNAASEYLEFARGVARALHAVAGPRLVTEAVGLTPLKLGQAVATKAYDLPNEYVIHCRGPAFGKDEPAERMLAECYQSALRVADDLELRSVALPAISTGEFQYPMQHAARVAIPTVLALAARLASVRRVRFVLYDDAALSAHVSVLAECAAEFGGKAAQ